MNYRLISAILKGTWLVDPRFALSHLHIVASMLDRQLEMGGGEDQPKQPVLEVLSSPGRKKVNTWNEAEPGSLAIIPVMGLMEKYDANDCGMVTYGMNTIARWIKEANQSPNIDGILLSMDTPGGTADGTQYLSSIVKNSEKPVVTFVDGLMASAGVWIGSGSRHVIAQNTTAEIGSIGVMLSFMDPTGFYETKGFKIHYITADQSMDKNLEFLEALKGNYELIRQDGLNPLASMFIESVKQNRQGKIPDGAPVFSGKVFFAEDALKYGLIDEIGSFEMAVKKLRELADTHKHTSKTQIKTRSEMKNLPTLMALLGLSSIEQTDEGVFLSTEQLGTIEARLTQINQVESERDQAKTELTTAQNTIAERDQTIQTLTKKPAAETAKIEASGDNNDTKDDMVEFCSTHSTAESIAKLKEAGY